MPLIHRQRTPDTANAAPELHPARRSMRKGWGRRNPPDMLTPHSRPLAAQRLRLRHPAVFWVFSVLLSGLTPLSVLAGSDNAPAASAAESICALLIGDTQQRQSECCGAPVNAALQELCSATLQPLAGSLKVDQKAWKTCAQDLATYRKDCGFVQQQLPPLPQSCRRLVDGQIAEGGRCQSSLSCADGLYCLGLSVGPTGVCAKPVKVGARCESAHDNLAGILNLNGLSEHRSCDGRCERGQCLAAGAAGASCQHSGQCQESLQCVQGQCQSAAPAAPGDQCDASHFCEFGSVCRDGHCQFRKPAGASCQTGLECAAFACTKAEGAESGTCAAVCPAGA